MKKRRLEIDLNDPTVRRTVAVSTIPDFINTCMPHYVSYRTAEFHWDLSDALLDEDIKMLEVMGFRDSAKSTYASTAFVLLVALTKKYSFIVLINDTTEQIRITLANIRYELEHNSHIHREFGKLKVSSSKWSELNIVLSNGVRIIGRSRGQNIRGIRHRQYRPDCIIIDDPEDFKLMRSKKYRDGTMRWFTSEVIPAQQSFGNKLVVVGNLLHNDGLIARIAKNPQFKVLRFPIVGGDGLPLWVDKYPTPEHLRLQREKVGNVTYSREYLLQIIAEENQVIRDEDIQRYPNSILTDHDERTGKAKITILDVAVGVDLAISESTTADYTGMVTLYSVMWGDKKRILVMPNPISRRMNFDVTLDTGVALKRVLPFGAKFYIEDVGYQRAALQGFSKKGLAVYPMRPISDKRARLQSVAPFLKDGTILFPEKGTEDLEVEIINLGVEEHDDLNDAFVYAALGLINKPTATGGAKSDKI